MIPMQPPWWQWTEFVFNGRQYRARLDNDLSIIEAEIRVYGKHRAPAWRRIVNPVTLQKLQEAIRPVPVCHACGQTLGAK